MARAGHKTLAQQLLALSRLPLTSIVRVVRNRLLWEGRLRPTEISQTYTVQLTYGGEHRAPPVSVITPELRAEEVDELPHVYDEDVLCLCYPEEFHPRMLIAKTIIPWASEWLLHFEIFRLTGDWHGGGHEPAVLPR